jgi:periplasmic mercuric ion binding protein
MTRKILFLITMIASLMTTSFSAMAAESKTVTLDVPGMTCKFCPITIRKALKKVPGVIDAKADFDTKTATVTFDPDKTNIDELMKATADAGYKSTLKK